MPAKPKITWIVIADAMRARVFRREKPGAPLLPTLEQELVNPAVHGFARDLKSDAPGRAFDTGSGARHSMEPRADPKIHQKQIFARDVALLINKAAERKEFDRLILIAPPKTLGDLRANLTRHASGLVSGELDRDLVHTPVSKLEDHLADLL